MIAAIQVNVVVVVIHVHLSCYAVYITEYMKMRFMSM